MFVIECTDMDSIKATMPASNSCLGLKQWTNFLSRYLGINRILQSCLPLPMHHGSRTSATSITTVKVSIPDVSYTLESSLKEQLADPCETFSQMLLRLINESGKDAVTVYKNANVDRKLFSKIRTDTHYIPRKKTVLSFAISLELSLETTEKLLGTAGYCFSESLKSDIIFKYFINQAHYDIYEIEAAVSALNHDTYDK